jgi:nucleoside-diphosphate-sugar epimerase
MHVFLTGATGLLGSEILVRLSQRPEIEQVTCLVRSRPGEDPLERLRRAFEFHGDALPERAISTLEGELGSDALSVALSRLEAAGRIHVVVNAAANTSFLAQNAAAIERANVKGVTQLLSWAKNLPNLRTFLQVSTAAVCGADRPRIVREEDGLDPNARQLVHYTASKLRAELALRRELSKEQLVIVRPSILMGDSRGLPPRAPVVLWAMAAINRLRLVPVSGTARLDVIPVDYAADAIVRLLFSERSHDVYHVSSGPALSTSAVQLSTLLAEYFRDLPPFLFLPGENPQFDAHAWYREYWQRSFGSPGAARALMRALAPYFKFMALDQSFDHRRLLADTGVAPPEPAHVYLRNNLRHIAGIDVLGASLDP